MFLNSSQNKHSIPMRETLYQSQIREHFGNPMMAITCVFAATFVFAQRVDTRPAGQLVPTDKDEIVGKLVVLVREASINRRVYIVCKCH